MFRDVDRGQVSGLDQFIVARASLRQGCANCGAHVAS